MTCAQNRMGCEKKLVPSGSMLRKVVVRQKFLTNVKRALEVSVP